MDRNIYVSIYLSIYIRIYIHIGYYTSIYIYTFTYTPICMYIQYPLVGIAITYSNMYRHT